MTKQKEPTQRWTLQGHACEARLVNDKYLAVVDGCVYGNPSATVKGALGTINRRLAFLAQQTATTVDHGALTARDMDRALTANAKAESWKRHVK